MLNAYFEQKNEQWESLCRRCGACCGAYEDTCRHLKKTVQNQYYCEIYATRFGVRQTVKGEKFNCVPLREIIHEAWPHDWLCTYKACLKTGR